MRRFSIFRIFSLLLLFVVTFLIAYVALVPTYVLQVSVDPRYSTSSEVKVSKESMISLYDGGDPVIVNMRGEVINPVIPKLALTVQPPGSIEVQTYTVEVSGPFFSKAIQLISRSGSITHGALYNYKLRAMNNNLDVSEGSISIEIKAVLSGTSPWFMFVTAFLGLLASIMQTIDLSLQYARKKKEENTQAAEPKE